MENNTKKSTGLLALACLGMSLGGCVSNPAEMSNTLNNVNAAAATAQSLKGGNVAGAANMAANGYAGNGNNASIAAMTNVQTDPRYKRGETALRQSTSLARASCKDLQNKQQATINSASELEPLVANLMVKQLYERLSVQRNSLADIGQSKRCNMPTVAKNIGTDAMTVSAAASSYTKLSCSSLKQEYAQVVKSQSAAATVGQAQGALTALTQVGSMFGGSSAALANAQQLNQVANTAGAVAGASGAVPEDLLQKKTDLESVAAQKRCNLSS